MADTATPTRSRARPRTPYLTLDQAAAELGMPPEVLHRHDEAVQAGDARPRSFPEVHDFGGERVIMRSDFDEFFRAADGTLVIGYGLMATWCGVKDQTLRARLWSRNNNIRVSGRPGPKDIPPPHSYATVLHELKDGGSVERDEPRWQPQVFRDWCRRTVNWLGRDDITPTRPRRPGRPRRLTGA